MSFADTNSVGLYISPEAAWGETPTPVSVTATITIAAAGKTATRSAGSFISDNVGAVGSYVKLGGYTNAGNNGIFKVTARSATVLTLEDPNAVLVNEAGGGDETVKQPAMIQVRHTGETLQYDKGTVASNQIRDDAQRDSHIMVSAKAGGAMNVELAFGQLMEYAFRAILRTSPVVVRSTGLTIDVDKEGPTFTRSSGSFITDGVVAGMYVRVKGCSNAGNNNVFRVVSLSATVLTVLDPDGVMVDETGAGSQSVFGYMFRNGTTKQSFLIEKRFTDIGVYEWFNGQRLGQLSLAVNANELITGSLTFSGKGATDSTATVSGADVTASVSVPMSASANVASVYMDGVVATAVLKSMSIDLNDNLRDQPRIGSLNMAGIGYGYSEATGKIEFYFEDRTLYQKIKTHTTVGLSIPITDNDDNTIVFTFDKVFLLKGSPNAPGANADVMLAVDFAADRGATYSTTVQIDYLAA